MTSGDPRQSVDRREMTVETDCDVPRESGVPEGTAEEGVPGNGEGGSGDGGSGVGGSGRGGSGIREVEWGEERRVEGEEREMGKQDGRRLSGEAGGSEIRRRVGGSRNRGGGK